MSETGTNFVGSKISLISKAGIRYLGTLVNINAAESTVALENVISFGTENRPCPTPYPPSKTTYNYIKFRGTDIADLHVFEQSQPQDPAIIEATQGPPSSHHLPGTPMGPPETSPGPLPNSNFNSSFSPNSSSTQRDTSGNFPNYQPQNAPTPANSFSDVGDAPKVSSPQPIRLHQEGEIKNSDQIEDENRGDTGNYRGRAGNSNQRKNSYNRRHREGLPYTNKTLSFDADFDFETANAKFNKTDVIEEFAKKIGKLSMTPNNDPEPTTEVKAEEGEQQVEGDDADQCYDKTKSFFDTISCEGLEKERGERRRPPSWQAERSRNSETFGEGVVSYQRRSYQNNYRGRGGYMNGGYGGGGGGGSNYGGGYQGGNRYNNNNNYNNNSGRSDNFYRGGYRNSGFRSDGGQQHGYNNREGYNNRREGYNNRDSNFTRENTGGYNAGSGGGGGRDYNRENWVPSSRDHTERNAYSNQGAHRDNRHRNNFMRHDEGQGQGRASYRRVERGARLQTEAV